MRSKALNPLQAGVMITKAGADIAVPVNSKVKSLSIILYKAGTNEIVREEKFLDRDRFGNIFTMSLKCKDIMQYDYNYRLDGDIITDPYAFAVNNKTEFGLHDSDRLTSRFADISVDFKDTKLHTDLSDNIIYKAHVRGFTMSKSSKVRNKGTFAGIIEKIPYLRELGINMLELMPCYDFDEIMEVKGSTDIKVNYWGYTGGSYFAPKASYCSEIYKKDRGSNPDTPYQIVEFREMVRELHKNGIELCMDFYFDKSMKNDMITDCLRFWALYYHVDAFNVNQDNVNIQALRDEHILGRTKMFTTYWGDSEDYYRSNNEFRHLANCNDGFLTNARQFLKGDENQTAGMSMKIKDNSNIANINYIANHCGFTLMDLVSYDKKNNLDNGENNTDGPEYNYSWNCGTEGETRRKKIVELRKKQIKNAFSMMLLSQGIPLFMAGDEFGNSQSGNNNPYCQDNELAYTSWNLANKYKDITEFVKELIKFRKQHGILHMKQSIRNMDYESFGTPDMSYHGLTPWKPDFDHVNRHFSVMYNERFSNPENKGYIYIAYNMHWENKTFGLPMVQKGLKWSKIIDTADSDKDNSDKDNSYDKLKTQRECLVLARSIVVLISR